MDVRLFLDNLRTRGVYRAAAYYCASAWALLQVADVIFPLLGLSDQAVTAVLVVTAACFPLVIVISWVFDLTPQGLVETPAAEIEAGREPRSLVRYAELALIVTLTGLVGYLYLDRLALQQELVKTPEKTVSAPPANSIAVMPFVAMSDLADVDYFGEGLAEEILNLLAKLDELQVAARTSSFYFKDKDVDIRTIGEHLGVAYVLEGSVRMEQEALRVTVQLINAADGFHLWSENYDRQFADVLALQDDIASAVVAQLQVLLSDKSRELLAHRRQVDPRSYDFYLRGRDYMRQPLDVQTREHAENMFERAVAEDGDFADAHAGLCEARLSLFTISKDSATFAAAEQACRRALELEGSAYAVHTALGRLYRVSGQYALAEREFDRAIELNPNGVDAYLGLAEALQGEGKVVLSERTLEHAAALNPNDWRVVMAMGNLLFESGRDQEALPYYQRIDDLLPDSGVASSNLGATYFRLGRFDEASKAWEESLRRAPSELAYVNLGTSHFFERDYEKAAINYRKAIEFMPGKAEIWGNLGDAYIHAADAAELARQAYTQAVRLARQHLQVNASDAETLAMLGYYLARLEEGEEARRLLQEAEQLAPESVYVYYFKATALSALDDKEAAFDALARAVELGWPRNLLAADAGLDPLHNVPGFTSLAEESDD
jgi:TolB-like protein/cytochrome c-type biogenesis protein CcmH/NrfG